MYGRPQTFSWGARTYFFSKNNEKDTIFPKKSLKTYYFWPALAGQGGGQEPPLALPCGRPWLNDGEIDMTPDIQQFVCAFENI